MLYAMLMAVFVLFILSFLMINIQQENKNTSKVDTDAQIQIVMTWKPDGIANDIDLWVKPPDGVAIGYSYKENTYMNLERDDLGEANDFAIINGKKVVIEGHTEVMAMRKCVPGEYIVNAQFYAIHLENPSSLVPTTVNVKLIQINPYKIFASEDFVLENQGSQHTAFSFTCGADEKIEEVNTNQQIPFVVGGNHDDPGLGGN